MLTAQIELQLFGHPARTIPLTQGKFALVDEEDYEELSKYKWYHNKGYAQRHIRKLDGTRSTIQMHLQLMGKWADHRNRNGLDNQKMNLRAATRGENNRNVSRRKDNTSGFKGVYRDRHKWRAEINVNGEKIHLGMFATLEDAHAAYVKAAVKHHGDFACFG